MNIDESFSFKLLKGLIVELKKEVLKRIHYSKIYYVLLVQNIRTTLC